ncbi:S8 family serine peptidase, partial [Candidatus Bipolaricaulota bacterium]
MTGSGLTSGITHGTAVAEIVHDVAPDAQLYLIKIADEVELDLAVTYCLSNGIDIINHSLGWYNTNFYDGTGTVADIARRAIAGGSLWVNAAGNEAESHWEGAFSDGNADGWLDQNISFYTTAGSQIIQFLTWNDWPQASSDYDLYLFDPASNLVASSTKHQTGTEEPTESIRTTAPSSGTYTIRIQGAGSRKLELFNLYQSISPVIASSSILAPANVAEVVTVGAIGYTQYTTGPQQPYSSQGPTNDGRTKPDLCAPDNVTTGTAPYTSFPGSSGAAPHAAGAAALLLSQNPALSESALRTTLLSQTVPMGSANIYGNGRLYLQPPGPSNQPPTALFTISPASGQVGEWFQFNASSSQDPDGSIVSYAWEYGDGTTDTGITSYHAYA